MIAYKIAKIEKALPSDIPYVAATLSKKVRAMKFMQSTTAPRYWAKCTYLETALNAILDHADIIVARGETGMDLGFCCYAGRVLYYVYVAKEFRGLGICKALLKEAGIDSSCVVMFGGQSDINKFVKKLQLDYIGPFGLSPLIERIKVKTNGPPKNQ